MRREPKSARPPANPEKGPTTGTKERCRESALRQERRVRCYFTVGLRPLTPCRLSAREDQKRSWFCRSGAEPRPASLITGVIGSFRSSLPTPRGTSRGGGRPPALAEPLVEILADGSHQRLHFGVQGKGCAGEACFL